MGTHLDGRSWLWSLRHGFVAWEERERDAVDLGVLRCEVPRRLIDRVAAPPQPTPDDLLTEQLAAEGPDAENVRDRVGVPPLSEHGDGYDAADVLSELALLSDGV